MSIDFKMKDFFYPFSILKFRNFLEKSQWFSLEEFIAYQENRLQEIINHAYEHVPYYRDLFDKLKLKPSEIRVLDDLKKLPLLTKKDLRNNFNELQAKDMKEFNPKLIYTSGTSGDRLGFFVDKPSNILEFSYYWRHWSWAGYHLGDRFAEFSSSFFMKQKDEISNSLFYFSKFSNRLLLNSLSISKDNVEPYVNILKKYKPSFLKGLPSVLFYFSKFLKEKAILDLKFKAIFSQGEILLDSHKKFIENVFNCKVYNSYGHMERTVAICECPYGGMHINPEYGVFETVDNVSSSEGYTGKVIGTSLHNFSMPLIRYEVGDYIEVEKGARCPCGREMSLVSKIHGRKEDV
ncbi:MAG: phenylacetate--CoA ligase family protein, partial [Candidatus Melainabacteria bacterium]|nr:phenylacetate--CoA ligase family protein [Candidatus Melainabacteria bacterium]